MLMALSCPILKLGQHIPVATIVTYLPRPYPESAGPTAPRSTRPQVVAIAFDCPSYTPESAKATAPKLIRTQAVIIELD
ncbi:hypothetical protein CHU98_g5178 [Xylaria longipes]|nr:hypothetical protein CHU98_g5178 [Xylaria longipes]